MKILINFLIITGLIYTMRTAGVNSDSWQYWVIILCAFALTLVEVIAREAET